MYHTSCPGTGERYVTTPEEIRVKLENTRIDFEEACLLTSVLQIFFKDTRPIEVEYALNKEHCKAWGAAWRAKRRVRINRPSVATLLHELSHILTSEGGHGRPFAKTLDICYGLYFMYLKTKVADHIPYQENSQHGKASSGNYCLLREV